MKVPGESDEERHARISRVLEKGKLPDIEDTEFLLMIANNALANGEIPHQGRLAMIVLEDSLKAMKKKARKQKRLL